MHPITKDFARVRATHECMEVAPPCDMQGDVCLTLARLKKGVAQWTGRPGPYARAVAAVKAHMDVCEAESENATKGPPMTCTWLTVRRAHARAVDLAVMAKNPRATAEVRNAYLEAEQAFDDALDALHKRNHETRR